MKFVDEFLNYITMYRLVLYVLLCFLGIAFIFSFFNFFSFSPLSLVLTTVFFVVVCYVTNKTFSLLLKAPVNFESIFITALILTCIITPTDKLNEFPSLFFIAVLATFSKFILAIKKKHIFNPAAFAVALSPFIISYGPSWWIGNIYMAIPVLVGGLLIVKKIRRWEMVFYFFATTLLTTLVFSFLENNFSINLFKKIFTNSPILFFAFIMFTEPLTTPPKRYLRIAYGILVGFLFSPKVHFGSFYLTPEIALILGNIFSYIVSPKEKSTLLFLQKVKLSETIYDFVFKPLEKYNFIPGQYVELTASLKNMDSRGNRRYLTIASSPTEDVIRFGTRISENGSAFKNGLLKMQVKDALIASSVLGDFTLSKDISKKLVFIAGGVGITPFRSIIKYLIDKGEKRDIILLYLVKNSNDAVYMDIFKEAERRFGIKIIVVAGSVWENINKELITKNIVDFKERMYYISGANSMVELCKKTLFEVGVSRSSIKTDYFPGYA